jgi:hypothetical protein
MSSAIMGRPSRPLCTSSWASNPAYFADTDQGDWFDLGATARMSDPFLSQFDAPSKQNFQGAAAFRQR